uniref:Uncharacterized protein n=1 Tax=Arundo donax TaxID=35708 RepID=A0A0A9H2T3_ARUDO
MNKCCPTICCNASILDGRSELISRAFLNYHLPEFATFCHLLIQISRS